MTEGNGMYRKDELIKMMPTEDEFVNAVSDEWADYMTNCLKNKIQFEMKTEVRVPIHNLLQIRQYDKKEYQHVMYSRNLESKLFEKCRDACLGKLDSMGFKTIIEENENNHYGTKFVNIVLKLNEDESE